MMLSLSRLRRPATPLIAACGLIGLAGCMYKPVPLPPAGTGPFGRVIFIGDSLSAGFQNGSLLDTQQSNGFASLVAKQAGFPISLPLIAAPGAPAVLQLTSIGPPPQISQTPGITTGRDNAGTQPSNIAVPGSLLHDVLYRTPTLTPSSDEDIITDLILGLPVGTFTSQAGAAVSLQPTTIFIWAGSNDALLGADLGNVSGMTSLPSFTADYTTLIGALKSHSNAHLVVANVADPTAIPFLTPATAVIDEIATITHLPGALVAYALGIAPGDLINGQGLSDIESEVAGLGKGGKLSPLPGSDVLTPSEVVDIQARVASYNAVIAQTVAAAGGTLVDVHSFFAGLAGGVTINGYHATTSFLGGLFGLDGVHPTSTAYALIANQYIAATNTAFHLSTPLVDVAAIAAGDPYFGPNIRPAAALGRTETASAHTAHIPADAARRSSQLIRGFREAATLPKM